MIYHYDLQLGLPHTNTRGLSEPLLLMHAGHFQWTSIASAIGLPLSRLRTLDGGQVYATFYFIEEAIPDLAPLESFGLDDDVRFAVSLRAFKNLSVEGQILFDRPARLAHHQWQGGAPLADARTRHPWIHFGNIFISPVQGNSLLRVAPPANADFSHLLPLPNAENPYQITRAGATTGTLQVIDDNWTELNVARPFDFYYRIDVDRDTNGAGLVYFANYVSFMETAERLALDLIESNTFEAVALTERSLRQRRVAYYGNVNVTDAVFIRVRVFATALRPDLIGFAIPSDANRTTL